MIECLKNAGYEHRGDLGLPGREAFKLALGLGAGGLPVHHLYACETGAFQFRKHLAYRDYLRAHPARAQWLAEQKLRVDAAANSRDEYIENKACYYDVINQEALAWAAETPAHPTE